MSRLNLHDRMWADPRFDALKIMVGNEFVAIGIMVKAFKLAQEFWGNDRSLIPIETWDLYPFNALEKAGLAERTEAGIYVKGSEENFDWLYKKRSSGRAGGLKSVQVRQNKYGTSKVLKSSEHEAPQEALEEADKKHSEKHCFVNDEAPKNPLSLSLSLNNKYIRANKPCANKGEIADEKQSIADEIVNLWNKDLAGVLPKVSRLTTKRRTTLNAQIKKYPDLAHWQDTITKIKASDFLTGKSGVWKASFDWIMSENNRIKIIEGNYENKTKEKEKWEDKVRWL